MEDRILNPKEFIYCLLYKKPRSTKSICEELYEKDRNSRVSHWINELYIDGHIKRTDKPGDQRFWLYYADPKYLFTSIFQSIGSWTDSRGDHPTLSFTEKEIIIKLIETKPFKEFVDDEVGLMVLEERGGKPFKKIKSCISEYCMFLESIADNIGYKHFSKVLECGKESLPYPHSAAGCLSMAFAEANPSGPLVNTLGYLLDSYNNHMDYYLKATVAITKKFL